jgi:hypothetical protein
MAARRTNAIARIPFGEVAADVTGKRVVAFDPKNEVDQLVRKQLWRAAQNKAKVLSLG